MLLVSNVYIVDHAFDPNFVVLVHIGLNERTGGDEFSISIWKIGFVFNLYSIKDGNLCAFIGPYKFWPIVLICGYDLCNFIFTLFFFNFFLFTLIYMIICITLNI